MCVVVCAHAGDANTTGCGDTRCTQRVPFFLLCRASCNNIPASGLWIAQGETNSAPTWLHASGGMHQAYWRATRTTIATFFG